MGCLFIWTSFFRNSAQFNRQAVLVQEAASASTSAKHFTSHLPQTWFGSWIMSEFQSTLLSWSFKLCGSRRNALFLQFVLDLGLWQYECILDPTILLNIFYNWCDTLPDLCGSSYWYVTFSRPSALLYQICLFIHPYIQIKTLLWKQNLCWSTFNSIEVG